MAKIGNSNMNIILNHLNEGRYDYDRFEDTYVDDTIIIFKRGRLEDAISVGLEKKYKKKFEKFGDINVSVDIELTDMSEFNLEDVADNIRIGVSFDNDALEMRDVIREIDKIIKPFKGFGVKYDKDVDDYFIVADNQDDIRYLFNELDKDGCNIKNFYKDLSGNDIINGLRKSYKEYKSDIDYLEREYRRS